MGWETMNALLPNPRKVRVLGVLAAAAILASGCGAGGEAPGAVSRSPAVRVR